MDIIGINGLWCDRSQIWPNLETAFRKRIDFDRFTVEELTFAHPWQIARLRKFGKTIVHLHDDGRPKLLLAHSAGVAIAQSIVAEFERSKILGIAAIFGPNSFPTRSFPRLIGAPNVCIVPLVTFQGARDRVVMWGTRHPQSLVHEILDSNHYWDLVKDPQHAEKIAEVTIRALNLKA